MDSFFIGQICLFPWSWTPSGWAKCEGQLLPIMENQALYALIGTEFGGDGRTKFALPNLPPVKAANGGDAAYFINLRGIFPSRS